MERESGGAGAVNLFAPERTYRFHCVKPPCDDDERRRTLRRTNTYIFPLPREPKTPRIPGVNRGCDDDEMHGTGHYHLNIKTGTRKTGQSAAAKYDYISRGGKYERARPDDIRHLESGNMPGFAEADPRRYWEAADDHERANGRVFRSMDMALPNELSRAEQIQLCQGFAQHVTGGELPYTLAIHAGQSKDGKRPDNPHMHLVFSERVNDGVDRAAELWFRRAATKDRDPETGGAKKTDRTKPRAWLDETRADWAKWTNQALEEHGSHIRIDHRTLYAQRADAEARGDAAAARALNRAPQMHLGPIPLPPLRGRRRGGAGPPAGVHGVRSRARAEHHGEDRRATRPGPRADRGVQRNPRGRPPRGPRVRDRADRRTTAGTDPQRGRPRG